MAGRTTTKEGTNWVSAALGEDYRPEEFEYLLVTPSRAPEKMRYGYFRVAQLDGGLGEHLIVMARERADGAA